MSESIIGLLEENKDFGNLVPHQDSLKLGPASIAFLLSRPEHPPRRQRRVTQQGDKKEIAEDPWCGVPIKVQWDLLASLLLEPLIIAFRSDFLLEFIIDSIHKLFAGGYVRGDSIAFFSPPLSQVLAVLSVDDQESEEDEKVTKEDDDDDRPVFVEVIDLLMKVFYVHAWNAIRSPGKQDPVKDNILARVANVVAFITDSCNVHKGALSKAVIILFNISLPPSGISPALALATLIRVTQDYFAKFVAANPAEISFTEDEPVKKSTKDTKKESPGEIAGRDCAVIITELCLQLEKRSHFNQEVKRKVLALQILRGILDEYSEISQSPVFVDQILRRKLCLALHTTSLSLPFIFSATLDVIAVLVSKYRAQLKAQIGLLFSMIFTCLRTKDIWSDFNEKLSLIYFKSILLDPQTVCDLYVNYDCDIHFHEDVIGTIIEFFSKFAYKQTEGQPPVHAISKQAVATQEATGLSFPEIDEAALVNLSLIAFTELLTSIRNCTRRSKEQSQGHNQMNSDDLQYEKQVKEILLQAGKIFDISPEQAFEHLVSCHVLKDTTPNSIGFFLADEETYFDIENLMKYFQKEPEVLKYTAKGLQWQRMYIEEALASFLHLLKFRKWAQDPNRDTKWIFHKFAEYYVAFGKSEYAKDDETVIGILKGMTILAEAGGNIKFRVWKLKVLSFIARAVEEKKIREEREAKKPNSTDTAKRIKGRWMEYDYYEDEDVTDTNISEGFSHYLEKLHTRVKQNQSFQKLLDLSDFLRARTKSVERRVQWRERTIQSFTPPASPYSQRVAHLKMAQSSPSEKAKNDTNIIKQSEEDPVADQKSLNGLRDFIKSSSDTHAKWLFQSSWATFLALFTTSWSHCHDEDEAVIALCLKGLSEAIHIASTFQLKTEQTALVSTLTKMCGVSAMFNPGHVTYGTAGYSTGGIEPLKEQTGKDSSPNQNIPGKRVGATRVLFDVAEKNSDLLGDCWVPVLQIFSQYQLLSHLPPEEIKMPEQVERVKRHVNLRHISQIFAQSLKMSRGGIYDFISAMCQVSNEELSHKPEPLTFMTIKIAEVIAINCSDKLDRDWKKIWKLVSKNLLRACFTQDPDTAIVICESVRLTVSQLLSLKMKAEDILLPIEALCQVPTLSALDVNVREYILQTVLLFHKNVAKLDSEAAWTAFLKCLICQNSVAYEPLIIEPLLDFSQEFAKSSHLGVLFSYSSDVFVLFLRILVGLTSSTLPSTPVESPLPPPRNPKRPMLPKNIILRRMDSFTPALTPGSSPIGSPRSVRSFSPAVTPSISPLASPRGERNDEDTDNVEEYYEYKEKVEEDVLELLSICRERTLTLFDVNSQEPENEQRKEKFLHVLKSFIRVSIVASSPKTQANARNTLLDFFEENKDFFPMRVWHDIFGSCFKFIRNRAIEDPRQEKLVRIVEISNTFIKFFLDYFAFFSELFEVLAHFLNDLLTLGSDGSRAGCTSIFNFTKDTLYLMTTKLDQSLLPEEHQDKFSKLVKRCEELQKQRK
eukprot:TRINITY_DN9812_c0_g1_i1.p1 TRINITY_DN9812_c0_g1~~TRINITY_DN9812_c0_g1_i1.p1  ORF type:complete len:1549 (+),score=263.74 TRINITY_DN9812_c0_g1_i1:139-4647(+)